MSKLEGHYVPTTFQSAIGQPLRSEQRTGELLPRLLTRVDMLVIFIAIVLFIPNASIVQATQGGGAITYLYWILGTVTFLIPGAIICAQLNRFMPVNGAIYVWTHRALGPLWGFFAGFCAWFPGVLVLLAASDSAILLLQGIGTQVAGANANWLSEPWQQGIIVIAILIAGGWLATLPLRPIMTLATSVIVIYALGIGIVGLAGIIWLMSGHASQVVLTIPKAQLGTPNYVLYGIIVLALLGVEVPLNMGAEIKEANATRLFLRWGPILVLIAYMLGTFGVMAVVPANVASMNYSAITAVGIVFGTPPAIIVGSIFILFFLMTASIYNATFARILFVSALDHRLPLSLAKVNRHKAPAIAINVQTTLVVLIAIFTYFVGPFLYGSQYNFTNEVYDVSQAATTVIWCLSMLFLFLDLPILLVRFRALFSKKKELLLVRPWLLYLCSLVGGIVSLFGIWTTLTLSWNTSLISNSDWSMYVGYSVIICLVIGLVGAAYPRLLSNLGEQTAAARENARLYSELSTAYNKLSELDQLKDDFLNTASHELRTPLTIVQGYLELLGEMGDVDAATRQTFVNKARRACDELVLLQANIMDASRIQFDAAALQGSSIPLKEICTSVIDLFEPLIIKEERAVNIAIAPDLIVWADETRLKQILRNLFSNALRYSAEYTPIAITATEDEEQQLVKINVIDKGYGVPPDKQEAIFERFVRLERDMHGASRGSGLGLAITRQLVEAMHGTLTVESSGIKGEGATFSFTLPTMGDAIQ